MESAVLRTRLLTLSGLTRFHSSGIISLMSLHPCGAIMQSVLSDHANCFWLVTCDLPKFNNSVPNRRHISSVRVYGEVVAFNIGSVLTKVLLNVDNRAVFFEHTRSKTQTDKV